MKNFLLLSIFSLSLSHAQVRDQNGNTAASSNNQSLSGNIGIGTTPSSGSPYKLLINGKTRITNDLLIGNPSGARTEINFSTNHKIYAPTNIKTIDLDGNFKGGGFVGVYRDDKVQRGAFMWANTDGNTFMSGVDKFTLNGTFSNGASLVSHLASGDSEALTGLQIATTNGVVVIGSWIGYEKNKGYGLVNRFKTKLENNLYVSSGSIGIGTNSFVDGSDTYRLSVEGKVRAHSVKVYTDWADYVFEPNYNLPSLFEVERFIKTNGHLKDIPSAKEVEANGIEVGEMNKLLLQKVEELTLYVIQLQKDFNELKQKTSKDE